VNTIKNVRRLFLGTLLLLGGCQDGASVDPPTLPTPSGDPAPLAVGPERRLDLIHHAVLAFRPQDGRLVGGYRTHQAAIGDGIVEVTPFTFDRGERRSHAPIALETTSITTDGELIGGGISSSDLDDGTVVLRRGDVEERLRNQVDGLHQEWSFATAPPPGDLVVDVTVTGYRFLQSTAGGLHFASSDGVGVRYSHAVWSGTDGKEWPITATFEDGRIRLTVPESVVAATEFPALLDPTVTAEVSVDAAVTSPTGASQQHPALAFDGTNFLVVWDDNRDGADSDIWGTRLSTAGAILDPIGIKIAATAGIQANPTVAFNGSTYLVAWEDFKVTDGTEADIGAARVSTAGAVTQLGRVAQTGTSETHPALAARPDGNALLVWNAAGTIAASAFSGAFGAATQIATGAVVERTGVAANPAGNYLVTWSAGTDLHGQLVTTAGALSGAAFNVSAALGSQLTSSAAFDGTNFAVVWENNNAGLNLYGARVSPTGTVLDTRTEGVATVGGVPISTAPDSQESPVIQCLASGCVVVWQDRRNLNASGFDVFAQRLNPNFTLNGAEIVVSNVTGNQFAPVVGVSGAAFFTVWGDLRDNVVSNVFASSISTAGAVGAAAPIATSANREASPSIGRAGALFGLFWSDSRTFGNDIRYIRFNGSGTKLDTTALVASSANFTQFTPAASTDLGANLLVVWADTRNGSNKDIFGARVSLATATTLDPGGLPIATATTDQLLPSVASSGTVALVVWQDRRNGTFDVFGSLVDSAGTVSPNFAISAAASDQTHPSVTWDPTVSQFIVVWADSRSGVQVDIVGARVSSAGAVLDPNGVLVSTAAGSRFAPVISSGSSGTFAAWQDRRNAPAGGYNIYGTRLKGGASLVVQDPFGLKLSNNTSRQSEPTLATLGGGWVVAWHDDRAGQGDIFGQQIAQVGTLSGGEFVISATPDDESAPTLISAAGSGSSLRVAYESHRNDSSRISTRLITTTLDSGSVCSGPGSCSTGFCVDGFCCNSACGGNHVPAGINTAGDCHGCAARFTAQPNGLCAPLAAGTICRNYASTFCDLREVCDGIGTVCGANVGRNQGLACNRNTNTPAGVGTGICPSNAAPGPHFCN
jgi:hypothetical protein